VFDVGVLYLSSLLAGVAIATALEREAGLKLHLKWPNDIYCGEKKLAGILCELQGSPIDEATLVVGVGVNLATAPTNTDIPATSLYAETGLLLQRDVLLAKLSESIVETFASAKLGGTEAILQVWRSRDFLYGRQVAVQQGDRSVTGQAQGIDNRGQLILVDEAGQQRFFSGGEVSIRW
jgi:BirA family biotin operon repressor/biotin-[acetyl-CoA-carboxylase] ligase